MKRFIVSFFIFMFSMVPSGAQTGDLQSILQENRKAVERASRKTIDPVLEALIASKLESVPSFLEAWRTKDIWQKKEDGFFFRVEKTGSKTYNLIDLETGATAGSATKKELKQLKPNSGVRSVIASALVQFQLSDPKENRRRDALASIERDPEAAHLSALRASLESETIPELKTRKQRLERLLTIQYDKDSAERINAIESFHDDVSVDVRAVFNRLLSRRLEVAKKIDQKTNVARKLSIGEDITLDVAYAKLVSNGLAKPLIDTTSRKAALIKNIKDGKVGEIAVSALDNQNARDEAYRTLEKAGLVSPIVSRTEQREIAAQYIFFERYIEPDQAVTTSARKALASIDTSVGVYSFFDLTLDGLSLASIYFLAAIGLAITFGVMGIINMAHGEFIMIGAYTGYVVQQFVPDYTASIIIALPLAFVIAGLAGIALERLVIRHLIHRPLETLLATFGISIALQQIAKNIFGTQARPLTAPGWLDGSLIINDIISISYIRIAIFVMALLFLVLLLFILNRTRLGLEVRAVTQNPRMAASMGINTDRVNMLTFALGSGIAGIAGVAIGLFAQVTSELGSSYIVQSFMTVVVGGVGNIWGTLAGAGMIGSFQKAIEWFNPSNTLAAQTYMIIFIIIFIQFRPKGIIALKGRAAGD